MSIELESLLMVKLEPWKYILAFVTESILKN